MRHDDPSFTSSQSTKSEPRSRSRAPAWVWTLALVALMTLTSFAVASALSAWLVPPYLILMCLVLFPTRRRDNSADREVTEPGPESIAGSLPDGAEVEPRPSTAAEDGSTAVESPDDQDRMPEPAAVKTRRGKKRKARGETVEPADVTWIRVGPGKFVRAESPHPAVADQPSKTEAEPPTLLRPPPAATEEQPIGFAHPEPVSETGPDHREEPPLQVANDQDDATVGNPSPSYEEAPPPDASATDTPTVEGRPETEADLPELVAQVAHRAEAFIATSGQPKCCDEMERDEPASVEKLSSLREEATFEAAPEPDDSTQIVHPEILEMHHDQFCVSNADADVWSDSRSRDETTFEDLGSETDESKNLPAVPMADDPEPGPDVVSGDNGIAPDASELDRRSTLQDTPPEDDGSGRLTPASSTTLSPRSPSGVVLASPRTNWRSVVTLMNRPSSATSPRRIARSGRTGPVTPGFRAHARRGSGRFREIIRTFPPRSPPPDRGPGAGGGGGQNRAAKFAGRLDLIPLRFLIIYILFNVYRIDLSHVMGVHDREVANWGKIFLLET